MDTAEVVWLKSPKHVEIRTEALAIPDDHSLLCSTIVTAISPGTELAAFHGLKPLSPTVEYPRLLGYCNVAEIVEVGAAVSDFSVGDRILSFSSHRSAFVISETKALYKLPCDMDADHAVLTYLFHLGYNAVLRSSIRVGSRVLVIGMGVLGLTSVAMAALAGGQVFAISDHSIPSQVAKDFGARTVFTRDSELLPENFADVVIVATNSWSDWYLALKSADKLANIAVLGFPGRGERLPTINPLDSKYFYSKQLRIEAVGFSPEFPDDRGFLRFNERANLKYLADQIAAGKLAPQALISGVYHSHKIKDAYFDLAERKNSPITFLLKWNSD